MLHHPAFDSVPYCGAKITPPPPLSLRPPFHEQHAGCGQDDSSPLDGRRPHLAGGQIPAQHDGDMDNGGEHERQPAFICSLERSRFPGAAIDPSTTLRCPIVSENDRRRKSASKSLRNRDYRLPTNPRSPVRRLRKSWECSVTHCCEVSYSCVTPSAKRPRLGRLKLALNRNPDYWLPFRTSNWFEFVDCIKSRGAICRKLFYGPMSP